MAVFVVARGGILREGLGYDRNDVAVVTNVAADHLGLRGIETIEQLAAVKRVIVEAVPRSGAAVLNADDELARDATALLRRGGLVLDGRGGVRGAGDDRGALSPWRQGCRPRLERARRDDHDLPRPPVDAARLDAPAARHLRWGCSVQHRERARRRRCGLRGRGAAARHPSGPADVHHVVLPLPRPHEPDQRQPAQWCGRRRRGPLPQRPRHARARRLRGAGTRSSDPGRPTSPSPRASA